MASKIIFLIALVYTVAASPVADVTKDQKYPIRLPTTLKPTDYVVKVQPFINGNFSINGFVEITFDVIEPTNKVILHAADIITHNDTVKLYPASGTPEDSLSIQSHEYYVPTEMYIATLEQELPAGSSYKIHMYYQAYLNADLKGFYRSSYTNEDGGKTWLAVTQFEPTDARRAFPCFDEPALKANFTIEITRENNMTSASNMPIAETVDADGQAGWSTDKYETSVPMSTYLVAFLVSDFEHRIAENSSPNYDFGVWVRKQLADEADYALQIAPDILRFYEGYFNVPFPLPKMDMATVPDFSAGAMENWGLITYREARLLYNEKISTAADKKSIGQVIAHELAHQWFGDIVTPSWWTDLWLNEGFASYMEYIGLNSVEPEMRLLEQIVVNDRSVALKLDCLQSSHPVRVTVNHPNEINQIFDKISYQKGASIILMMNHFVTENTFTAGLSNYLKGLSYKAAEQDDLWGYLTEQAHADDTLPQDITVKDIMDTWTLQMGYPVIHVTINGDGSAKITQERFLLVEDSTSTDTHDYKWWIPLTFTNGEDQDFTNTKPSIWMSPEESEKTIDVPQTDTWYIFNNQATGFYRVNYDKENWDKITEQLKSDHEVLNNLNRAQIIDDSLNLARSGRLGYETAFNILAYLKNEKDYMPIKSALDNIRYLKNMFAHTGGYGALKSFLLSTLAPHYDELTFDDSINDPHLVQLLRTEVLDWACSLGYKPCIEKSVELFQNWMEDPDNYELVSPNLKSVVYCTAISEGGDKEWSFAWERYQHTSSSSEKVLLLKAMACTSQEWILSDYLNRSLTVGKGIRKQDVRYVIPAIARNTKGRLLAWEYIREHWRHIVQYFGSVSFSLDDVLSGVTESLNTAIQVAEIEEFIEKEEGKFSSAYQTVQQSAENARNNLAWMNHYYGIIVNWFEDNDYAIPL